MAASSAYAQAEASARSAEMALEVRCSPDRLLLPSVPLAVDFVSSRRAVWRPAGGGGGANIPEVCVCCQGGGLTALGCARKQGCGATGLRPEGALELTIVQLDASDLRAWRFVIPSNVARGATPQTWVKAERDAANFAAARLTDEDLSYEAHCITTRSVDGAWIISPKCWKYSDDAVVIPLWRRSSGYAHSPRRRSRAAFQIRSRTRSGWRGCVGQGWTARQQRRRQDLLGAMSRMLASNKQVLQTRLPRQVRHHTKSGRRGGRDNSGGDGGLIQRAGSHHISVCPATPPRRHDSR